MRAVLWTKYGPPEALKLGELEKPSPKDNEVLIKVHAATVTAGDCEMRALKFPFWLWLPIRLYVGLIRPIRVKVLGQELAGEIEAVGEDVTHFKVGDQVFGTPGFAFGAYAEYLCLPAKPDTGLLAIKPASMSYEEAAAVPIGAMEALHFLRLGNIQRGERVLINGAGGSIGTFGVQLAKHFGAEVTAVDSAGKLDMLRALGADHVIDYTREDFSQTSETYDVIFDVAGKSPFARSLRALRQNGRYLLANPRLSHRLRGRWAPISGGKQVISETASPSLEDLLSLTELIEGGKMKVVIDRTYPLEQTADAHRYVETGQKKGNVVIAIGHES